MGKYPRPHKVGGSHRSVSPLLPSLLPTVLSHLQPSRLNDGASLLQHIHPNHGCFKNETPEASFSQKHHLFRSTPTANKC